MENNLPKVTDVCKRSVLSEGRNYQMGFAFCKEVKPGVFETVQPLSPCKDYLNDVVYSEHTGKPFSACGLKTKKHGLFEKDHATLAIKILNTQSGTWPGSASVGSYEDNVKNLRTNYKNIETLLNYVEETFTDQGCLDRTVVEESEDKEIFLVHAPLWWCRSTHLISLYSLFIRMGQFWNGGGKPEKFLEEYKVPLDIQLWKPSYGSGAYNNYKCMLKYGVRVVNPNELYDRRPEGPNVHGNGILNY